jgi:hypothetical protein
LVIPNLYYYLSYFIYLLQVYIWYFFQIKLFKWYVINVWAIMHIDTHFLELEYFNYDNLKPSKNSFLKYRFEAPKTYFSIWITNLFCVCNMVICALKIIWKSHKNELKKGKVLVIVYVYFVQNRTTTPNKEKSVKVGEKKIKHNILSF